MEYSSTQDGTKCEFSFRGKFAFADNDSVRNIIEEFKSSGCSHCAVQLGGLEEIDSAGLGMLILISDAVKEDGKSIEFCSPNGQPQKMLEISKFADIITIKP
ncbi:MAG: STAS domain-containing protein [Rhodospirillales bacterium]|nr:STAS domain-containing protein [Rhodospirillales bacterium]MBT8005329.1 STAS domain-containing protein [Rhodospirillales bacterium]